MVDQEERAFRFLTPAQRRQRIAQQRALSANQVAIVKHNATDAEALLTENYLTTYRLPEGVAVNLLMNQRTYQVPMVTEEPSVVAAASYGGLMTTESGGLIAQTLGQALTGQILFEDIDFEQLRTLVDANEDELKRRSLAGHPSLTDHGGQIKTLVVRDLADGFASVDLTVDTGAAMGANTMNDLLNALGEQLAQHLGHQPLTAILTNDGQASLVKVTTQVSFARLAKGDAATGAGVAQRIVSLSELAQRDVSRAVTHNKGIMNGIDAFVVATGNDWRAVEASAHAYAVKAGQYRGLATWQLGENRLLGELTMPMHLGLVGGATASLPLAKVNHQIAGVQTVTELNQLAVALGLVQNLAALRALVSEGIQPGHMALQYRNLALAAGATPTQVVKLVPQLTALTRPSLEDAKRLLAELLNDSK